MKYMHHRIEVIDANPHTRLLPLDMVGFNPEDLHYLASDVGRYRPNLGCGGAFADNEEIGRRVV